MDFHTIVIGSGAGGLTAALAVARTGHDVLVVERSPWAGGWCHAFEFEGHRFDTGVHHVGQLQPGGRLRRVLEGLGLTRDLVFCELRPDAIDHVRIGEERFALGRGPDEIVRSLSASFPADSAGIRSVVDILVRVVDELTDLAPTRRTRNIAAVLGRAPTLVRWGARPLSRLLEHCGWYPMGGSQSLVDAFVAGIERRRGVVRTGIAVAAILVDRSQVTLGSLVDVREALFDHVHTSALSDAPTFPGFHLTLTSLKDPTQAHDGLHTLEAFAFTPWEPFADWDGAPPGDRPSEYDVLKERLRDRLVRTVQTAIPDLPDRMVLSTVGTPLTNRSWMNATRGNLYGTEKVLGQVWPIGFGGRTGIENLWLCGASTGAMGVLGTTWSGLCAAAGAWASRSTTCCLPGSRP